MIGKTIRSRMTILVAMLLILAIVGSAIIATIAFNRTIKKSTYDRLKLQAGLLARIINVQGSDIDYEWLQLFSEQTNVRLTLIEKDGSVIFDSHYDETNMDNHGLRQEVVLARQYGEATIERKSATQNLPVLYYAQSLVDNGTVEVLRLSCLLEELHDYNKTYGTLIIVGVGILLSIGSAATVLSINYLTKPLHRISSTAKEHAKGNLDARVYVEYPQELFELATTINSMAIELNDKISEIQRERQQYSEILDSMTEGILYVDVNLIIIEANKAAFDLLVGPNESKENLNGMRLVQIAGATEILKLCNKTIIERSTRELEIDHFGHLFGESARLMGKRETKTLRIVFNPMLSTEQQSQVTGIVMTINDVTELKLLENIRKEFVANVSHELKTPITAIAGFIDALTDMETEKDVEATQRFIGIIKRQTVRMQHIVEDLLLLSSLEQQHATPTKTWTNIEQIVGQVQDSYRYLASERQTDVTIKVDNPDNLPLLVNGMLIVQALANLIVNAITYSPEASEVSVAITINHKAAQFTVSDHGCGIPKDAVDNIFERFYRVDKARSRRQGGTGLGLSIVKHIVQVHGGTITVTSEEGVGSAFTVTLPSLETFLS
ncbi:MAG: ATP-binding protein [Sphaerochaetaceae bacterium]|nr:ATP-binding protein [Sphaerochaetaceae bacterium]